MDRAKR